MREEMRCGKIRFPRCSSPPTVPPSQPQQLSTPPALNCARWFSRLPWSVRAGEEWCLRRTLARPVALTVRAGRPNHVQEQPVEARIRSEFRMEGRREEVALACRYRGAVG